MWKSRLIAVTLAALLGVSWLSCVPLSQAATTSGFTVESAVWGTPSAPVEAGPDSQNVPLTITLQYYFYNTAQSISITLTLPPGFTDIDGNSATTAYVSNQVPSGAVLPVTFYLNIASSATVGNYVFPMSISWAAITQPAPYLQSVSETQNTQATVQLKGKVILQFSAGQSALTAGAVNLLPIVVTNAGTGNATSVDIALVSSTVVSVLNTSPEISLIRPNSSVTSYVDVYVAPSLAGSSVPLAIGGTYSDAYGNTHQISTSIGMYVKSISSTPGTPSPSLGLSGYSYNPPLIFPGTTVASLEVVIFNSGSTSGSNVSATIIPSDPVYPITSGSLFQAAGLLPAGQSIPFTFTLGIQNSTQAINSTLTLVIKSSGVAPVSFSIPFVEQPRADFRVVSVLTSQITAGDASDQVTVEIRNTGPAAAQSATLTILPSDVFAPSTSGTFASSGTISVGNLAPGEETALALVIQVNSGIQSGSYPLGLLVTWNQPGTAQPFTEQETVMLPVSPSVLQTLNSDVESIYTLIAILIIVALIIALVVIRRVRGS